MSITSLTFVVFVLGVMVVNRGLPQRARPYWLLFSSYVFYATWAVSFLAVVATLTAVDFGLAERMRTGTRWRRASLWTGISANALAIVALRHGRWFGTVGVVGLSFYGIQGISYLVDTYTGALRIRPSFVELAVYLAYFPKLLAGPIERATGFVSHLRRRVDPDEHATAHAVCLIALGAVRKVVIADNLAILVPPAAFSAPATLPAGTLAYALVTFMFFLYNDFAGYTDIVRGTSSLLGIPLTVNFRQPFFASDFFDFWNRWHASLSHWLRDYVYLPVSRTLLRRKWSMRSLPMLVVPAMSAMLVSGVWHGATPSMMVWGGLQGSYLIAGRIAAARRPGGRAPARAAWRRVVGPVSVFVFVTLASVVTNADLATSLQFWRSLVGANGWVLPSAAICALVGLSLVIDVMQYRSADEVVFLRWPRPLQAALLACAIVGCALATGARTPSAFVYQEF